MPMAGWRPFSEEIDTSAPPSMRCLPAYLATMNDPGEAHVDNRAELLDGHVDDEPDIAEPGAAHHDVDRPGLREEGGDGILVDDVDERRSVRRAELGGPGLCSVEVAVGDDHPVTLGRQCPRGRPADAGRAADDDGGGHCVLPSGRGSAHLAAIAPHGSA